MQASCLNTVPFPAPSKGYWKFLLLLPLHLVDCWGISQKKSCKQQRMYAPHSLIKSHKLIALKMRSTNERCSALACLLEPMPSVQSRIRLCGAVSSQASSCECLHFRRITIKIYQKQTKFKLPSSHFMAKGSHIDSRNNRSQITGICIIIRRHVTLEDKTVRAEDKGSMITSVGGIAL